MHSQHFLLKSGVSAAIPLALVLLLAAAPVKGEDAQASTTQDTEAPSEGIEQTSRPVETVQGSAAEAAPRSTAPMQQDEVEVTADRVRQPLPTPDANARLPRLYLTDMEPWNWEGLWHASGWDNGDSTIPWKYGRVQQGFGGDTHFVLNSSGAAELKAQRGHPAWTAAMYEVDVTLPTMRPGLIASPIWLWDKNTKESVAVQIVGNRHMQFTIHGVTDGVKSSEESRVPGDYSGRRMKIAIRRHAGLGLIDIFVDGELAHSFNEDSSAFPRSPMRPIISLYPADKHGWAKQWAGTWQPMSSNDRIRMTVHGFRATPL